MAARQENFPEGKHDLSSRHGDFQSFAKNAHFSLICERRPPCAQTFKNAEAFCQIISSSISRRASFVGVEPKTAMTIAAATTHPITNNTLDSVALLFLAAVCRPLNILAPCSRWRWRVWRASFTEGPPCRHSSRKPSLLAA